MKKIAFIIPIALLTSIGVLFKGILLKKIIFKKKKDGNFFNKFYKIFHRTAVQMSTIDKMLGVVNCLSFRK